MATGYVYDPIFLKHTRQGHPESAQRLITILAELESAGLLKLLQQVPSRAATPDELSYVHPVSYINQIREISQLGDGDLDPETYTNRYTFDAAAVAVGGLIDLEPIRKLLA